MSYIVYMHRKWGAIRRKVKKLRGYRCELCGTAEGLSVRNLKDEYEKSIVENLVLLCKRCMKLVDEDLLYKNRCCFEQWVSDKRGQVLFDFSDMGVR